MINKKKVLLTGVLAIVILFGGMFVGSKIGANTSWTNEVFALANKQIGETGFNKKEELKDRDITNEMKKSLNPVIAEEQAALEKLLEEYYQMKLDGLSDTEEFRLVEEKIGEVKLSIFNRYKSEIDLLFKK